VSSGHLVYVLEATLFAVRFDLERLSPVGESVPVIEGVMASDNMSGSQFAVSDNGTLVYLPGAKPEAEPPISWLDRSGKVTTLTSNARTWGNPRFSSKGDRLVFDINDGAGDIWTYDLERRSLDRLTVGINTPDAGPIWTPDDRRIVYRRAADPARSGANLYWRRADGIGGEQRLTESQRPQVPGSFHPSGRFLAFHQDGGPTALDIWILPIEGDEASGFKPGTPTPLINGQATELDPNFSPDGKWIAYTSNRSGTNEVWVRPFPDEGGPWQISSDGGTYPVWSRTRQELFYVSNNGQLMVATYRVVGDAFQRDGEPHPWSETRILLRGRRRSFDLHPDGNRMVLAVAPPIAETVKQDKVVLVFNFFDELRRLVR
jgi:serine/threonine-protein kinase